MNVLRRLLDGWKGGDASRLEFEAIRAEVTRLTLKEAKSEMARLFADPDRYTLEEATSTIEGIPPAAATLLRNYAYVAERYGDTVLGHGYVGPSEMPGLEDFIRIGSSTDGTEVVARLTGDTVYRVDGSEDREEFPSVFHLLLHDARIIYPEAFGAGGEPRDR